MASLMLLAPVGPIEAEVLSSDELVPWALMLDEGSGGIEDVEVGGRSIQVVRIPISFPLIELEKRGYGLRFTLPVSFGFHELTADIVQEGEIRENLSTVTVLPGLEWILALPDRGVIKPFGEVGFSSDLDNSQSVGLFSTGLRVLRPIGAPAHRTQVGALVKYSWSSLDGAAETDSILTGELGIERKFGLRFAVLGETTSFGIHGLVHHAFTRILLKELDTSTTEIKRTAYEIGVSIGTENDVTLLGFRLPRIGLSYRSSGDFRSWRLNFGFPF